MLSTSGNDAAAQSRAAICKSLNSQLASVSSGGSGGGNSAQYRKFDNAVRAQQTQISKTKRIARRGRCTGLGFLNTRSAQCKRVITSLKKMEANLRSLKNSRAKNAPKSSNNSRLRNRILKRIKQNRCNTKIKTAKVQPPKKTKSKRRALLEQVFGVKTYSDTGQRKNTAKKQNSNNNNNLGSISISRYGTFRTLCVRKSDGYYFPISFSTVSVRFEEDSQTCQQMCPSSEVELYHHKMPSEDSEEMINYQTGKPYVDEPFAFAYRKSVDLENKCRFATHNRFNSIEVATDTKLPETESNIIGKPVFRENPALIPDDHDIKKGNLTMAQIQSYLAVSNAPEEVQENQVVAENRKIRIVGPAFFPVQ